MSTCLCGSFFSFYTLTCITFRNNFLHTLLRTILQNVMKCILKILLLCTSLCFHIASVWVSAILCMSCI